MPIGEWNWYEDNGRKILATTHFERGTGTMYSFYPGGEKRAETPYIK